jgi:hypothetical protein
MAKISEPYSAGLSVQSLDADSLLKAARTILRDYARFTRNALECGKALRARSWKPLLELIEGSE